MTFANADAFLLLLLLIPLAVAKIIGDGMARRRVLRIAGARLLPRLQRGGWRGRELLVFLFEVLAIAFFITALARPQWGYTEKVMQGEGRSIIIAIDTSRSMLADDVKPDRLTRAKLAAVDLVASLPGDRIGLIAFAGRAFLQAPLTTDHEALIEALQQFDAELIPRGGSNPSEAIKLASEVFDKSGTATHALIMFSDGDETEGAAVEAARNAKDHGVMIVAVGVGTRDGALLPDPNPQRRTGFLRDASGRPVRSKLEDRVLEALARETGGLYLNLSSGSELKERVQVILNKLDRSRTAAQKEKRQPIERYVWALLPGMACLVIAFALRLGRRLRAPAPALNEAAFGAGALVVFLLGAGAAEGGVILPGGSSGASPWRLYNAARYDEAAERFADELGTKPSRGRATKLEFGRGAAAFQQKDHDTAIEAFGLALTSTERSLQVESAYNLGNSLADKAKNIPKGKGRVSAMIELITQAIDHYDEALKIQPGHTNAKENRDALIEYLEKLKEYRQQLRDKAKQKKQNKGDKGNQSQQQQGQQGQDQQEGQQGQQGEQQAGGQGQGEEEDEEEAEEEEGGEQPGEGESAGDEQESQGKDSGEDTQGEGKGKQDDQQSPAPEGQEKERSGEQKQEGQVEAKAGGQGNQGDDQKKKAGEKTGPNADAQRNKKTGFSRSEARALLRALSDEDYVRPLTDRAQPEGSYKNW